jgi:GT2 family glycosyltransferase
MAMDLSVVIVNWNTKDMLRKCLQSLFQGNTINIEIWVIDNASDDGSVEMVRAEFPRVKLIVNQKNVGFARANNQALAQSTGRYCLLLNPDTVVPACALDNLVQFIEDTPDAGVVGCAQIYPDGRRQATCHRAITLWREVFIAFGLARVFRNVIDYGMHPAKLSTPRRVDWVEGGALLVRRSVLATIGLMDEAFFMYVEDADLCFRVRQANLVVYYVPDIQIIHYRGQATGFEQRERRQQRVNVDLLIALHRSKAYFLRKHYGGWQAKVYRLLTIIYCLRKLSMGLGFYSLRGIERETWGDVSSAYLGLLRTDLRNGSPDVP